MSAWVLWPLWRDTEQGYSYKRMRSLCPRYENGFFVYLCA
jgi:hypothetical protein